jgi:hypothetical protein
MLVDDIDHPLYQKRTKIEANKSTPANGSFSLLMNKSPKFADYKAHKPFFREMIAMPRRNRLLIPEAADALQRMKFEVAQEFGVELGPDTTARANGSVGGEMVKRLIALAQSQISVP